MGMKQIRGRSLTSPHPARMPRGQWITGPEFVTYVPFLLFGPLADYDCYGPTGTEEGMSAIFESSFH